VELLVFAVFFLVNLRVFSWFEPPYIVTGGDFRPPLVPGAFLKRVLYAWNDVDLGVPSIYSPRILDPFYFLVTAFQYAGANTYISQLAATFLIYLITSVLTYVYVKRLTNGDIITAFLAALFFTSNIHLVVDREQTAIGFVDMALTILPSLVVFVSGLRKESYRLMAISGLLFVLTYGAFPNYRASFLCLIGILLTLLFVYLDRGLGISYRRTGIMRSLDTSSNLSLAWKYFKYLIVFAAALLLVSIWVMALVSANFNSFLAAYNQMAAPVFVLYIKPLDVLRLIAKWSFYNGALGQPYVPYAAVYINNPAVIVLSYIPTVLAFAAIFVSKSRKTAIYFTGVAVLFLILTTGFVPYFSQLYFALTTNLPLLAAFREPTNWIFIVILCFSILVGLTFSALYHRIRSKALKIFVVGLAVTLFLCTSYPLMTGDITRNWLDTAVKGSYFPPYFRDIDGTISNRYWSLMLPQRYVYVAYNFSSGAFACGNPYPLIFSNPIISGGGTEYVQSEHLDLINTAYEWILTNKYENVAPEGNVSASSVEKKRLVPAQAVDGKYDTRWASEPGLPQWFEIEWNETQELSRTKIVFESAVANDYTLETWNGSSWTTQAEVENNTLLEHEYIFPQLIPTTRLRVNFTRASSFGMVSMWELETYAQKEGVPKFLGILGIKDLIVEKDIVSGNLSTVDDLRLLNESKKLTLIREWDGASLFENAYALEKLYTANNITLFSDFVDLYNLVQDSDWSTLQHTTFVNSTSDTNWASQIRTLVAPESFTWKEESPTSYRANVRSDGEFVLVLLESYNPHWKAYVDGRPIPENDHIRVNAYANGWLIAATGNVTITIEYETQGLLAVSVAATVALSALFVAFLVRKDIKRVAREILLQIQKKIRLT
jgi:hypothetical protein